MQIPPMICLLRGCGEVLEEHVGTDMAMVVFGKWALEHDSVVL